MMDQQPTLIKPGNEPTQCFTPVSDESPPPQQIVVQQYYCQPARCADDYDELVFPDIFYYAGWLAFCCYCNHLVGPSDTPDISSCIPVAVAVIAGFLVIGWLCRMWRSKA